MTKTAQTRLSPTLTTNASGVAETGNLPFGSYTLQETSAPAGYVVDSTVHSITLAYQDQCTAIVTATVKVEND
jgi:uncharacterized surface anchored protein